jgi:Plasmid pRiA4b ORF-3-like protein
VEGIHLYQFCLRAARYGSSELSASSPEVALAALQLRKGARFAYEYNLNNPWRHEVRIEDHLSAKPDKAHPRSPEDCGGPAGFMVERHAMLSLNTLEDRETMAEIIGQEHFQLNPDHAS